ncbi:MAG: A/G-specific adenine glycosylase [Eubacteriales bacterium]|nr:A/G-specific adenine glycosylase [Eubacteriales bacterium]
MYKEQNDALLEIRRTYGQLQLAETKTDGLSLPDRLRAMNRPLLAWYGSHARVLPWREDPQPYRVWISEIMLQQTRVEAVKPYFERFMEALPDVQALAEVPDDRLMKLWEGLGYYNRARNLKKAAGLVMSRYGGRMPSEYSELLSLPGIGSYTAGAISSIAFGRPVPAVDGNVLRVISRVAASREDILKASTKRRMEDALRQTMPADQASSFNQGLIEVGALVCVPNGQPKCKECPFFSICLARQQKLLGQIPVKTPPKKRRIEERTVCILECGGQVAIYRRADTGLLASLYELPNKEGYLKQDQLAEAFGFSEGDVTEITPLPEAKHIFSHVEWRMKGYYVRLSGGLPGDCTAAGKQQLKQVYALPNAFGAYTKLIK